MVTWNRRFQEMWQLSEPLLRGGDAEAAEAYFLKAIREDLDLSESMAAAVNSLRIVLAADESIRTERAIELA